MLRSMQHVSTKRDLGCDRYNWSTLNQKVFKRHLGFVLAKSELEAVCNCEARAVMARHSDNLSSEQLNISEHKQCFDRLGLLSVS